MTPEIRSALEEALTKLRATAVDPEILDALGVPEDLDSKDSAAVEAHAKQMLEHHPALFKVEKAWSDLDPDSDEWLEREKAFRSGLSKSRPFQKPDFVREIDASRLGAEELRALEKAMTGHGNSWDRGLLTKALGRQRLEDTGRAS